MQRLADFHIEIRCFGASAVARIQNCSLGAQIPRAIDDFVGVGNGVDGNVERYFC